MLENEFRLIMCLLWQTVILRGLVYHNLSFESMFGENFCMGTLLPFRYFSIHVKVCVLFNLGPRAFAVRR